MGESGGSSVEPAPGAPGRTDLVSYLGDFLQIPEPKFFLIVGNIGSGKSTLLRTLAPKLGGPKLFLAFLPGPPAPASGGYAGAEAPSVSMLLIEPGRGSPDGTPAARGPVSSSSLAFSPQDRGGNARGAEPLTEAVARLVERGSGSIIVDSWDRGSDSYFRSQAEGSGDIVKFNAPPSALAELQSSILSTPVRFLLSVTPDLGAPLLSMADAVVNLREEDHTGGRLRVATVTKIRGPTHPMTDHLYTLDGGRFSSLPSLPPGFRPPVGAADPDPDAQPQSAWPGSTEFARALGRLRFGGVTALTLAPDCPDTVPLVIAAPIAIHALRTGGRVVWVTPPSIRPSQIVGILKRFVPEDWMRERLRFLAASGDDQTLGDLRSVILPMLRDMRSDTELRTASAPGVRALFPEVYRFYQERGEATSSIMIGSFEGLRAVAAAAGVTIDTTTVPVILGSYARLPKFHLFGYCDRGDPVVAHLRPGVDTLCEIEMVHGRPVLYGLRPTTPPYLLDWPDPDGRYRLVTVA
ncbi:MAG TPA: hypothetical protein VGP88_09560 [Thermoplasmata archaeon]|jgi:KaiC/GvpD/RAD55 family RecA-like ATPase|nr:hypothetical protein [Thermoplasmata archaeon]